MSAQLTDERSEERKLFARIYPALIFTKLVLGQMIKFKRSTPKSQ